MTGYNEQFLSDFTIEKPLLSSQSIVDHYENFDLEVDDFYLDYVHYSLLQSPFRRFPFYTATNIDGGQFRGIQRKALFNGESDQWKKDDRISDSHQYGLELYRAPVSDFDRGHLTKREDTQWGESDEMAIEGGRSTFYYTNSVPQMPKMNRGIWKEIENYILHDETVNSQQKITMFTGPVLSHSDPYFVTIVDEEQVQIPSHFFKIVYYVKDETLYRTGFLVGQRKLLVKHGIVKDIMRGEEFDDPFYQFKDAETYQVRVSVIEEMTGMLFHHCDEVLQDDRPRKLIVEEVNARNEASTQKVIVKNLTL